MMKKFNTKEIFDYVVKNGSYNELLTFLGRLHADRVQSQVHVSFHLSDWKVGESLPDVYECEIQTFDDYAIDNEAASDFEDWYWDICRTYGEPDSGESRYEGLLSIGYYLSVGAARLMLIERVEAEAQARQSAGGPDPYDMHGDVHDNDLKSILIDLVNNDPQFLM